MGFYVSHMSPHKRARIHKAKCPDCRDGQGQQGQHRTGSGATGWDGPFGTLKQAEDFMASRFPHFTDARKCGRCKPGVE